MSLGPAPLTIRSSTTLKSDPRELWPLRHLIRVMTTWPDPIRLAYLDTYLPNPTSLLLQRLVSALLYQFLCCLQLICLHTFTFTMTGAKKRQLIFLHIFTFTTTGAEKATTHFSSHFHFHNDRSWKSDNSFVFTLLLSQWPELKKRQLICLHTFTFTTTGAGAKTSIVCIFSCPQIAQ